MTLDRFTANASVNVAGLRPEFAALVEPFLLAAHAAGHRITINSAYRSIEHQRRLFASAVKRYGSEAKARKWVAPPGRSQHNYGVAVDLGVNGAALKPGMAAHTWAHREIKQFGLWFPMSWEGWHIAPVGVRTYADADGWDDGAPDVPAGDPSPAGATTPPLQGGSGMRYTAPQIRELAIANGWPKSVTPIVAAIAIAESTGNPSAVGDKHLADGKWGDSIGLLQIRSLRAQKGTGKERDEDRLKDPTFNLKAGLTVYRQAGNSFTPWATYNTGAYKPYLKAAGGAATPAGTGGGASGGAAASTGAPPSGSASIGDRQVEVGIPGVASVGISRDLPVVGPIAGAAADATGAAVGFVTAPFADFMAALPRIAATVLLGGSAVALVVIGARQAVR